MSIESDTLGRKIVLTLLVGLLANCGLLAETLTLVSTADTFISEHFAGPNGPNTEMVIGTQGTMAGFARNRGLLKFDGIGQIPSNATLTSVTLTLVVIKAPTAGPDSDFNLHRMLRDWSEASSTWPLRLAPDQMWGTPGAAPAIDFSETVSTTQFVQGPGTYIFNSTSNLIADLSAWVKQPSSNYGWLVKTADEAVGSSARRFCAREIVVGAPSLQVQYELGSRPRISLAQVVANQFCLQFPVEVGKAYVVERRVLINTGSWTVVTNLPPATNAQTVVVCEPLGTGNRFYRVGED